MSLQQLVNGLYFLHLSAADGSVMPEKGGARQLVIKLQWCSLIFHCYKSGKIRQFPKAKNRKRYTYLNSKAAETLEISPICLGYSRSACQDFGTNKLPIKAGMLLLRTLNINPGLCWHKSPRTWKPLGSRAAQSRSSSFSKKLFGNLCTTHSSFLTLDGSNSMHLPEVFYSI